MPVKDRRAFSISPRDKAVLLQCSKTLNTILYFKLAYLRSLRRLLRPPQLTISTEIMLILFIFVNQTATLLDCFLTLAARPTVEFSCAVSRTTPWNLRCSFRRRDNRRFPRFAISVLIWVRAAAELVVDIFMFALVARDFSGASGHVEGGYRERRA